MILIATMGKPCIYTCTLQKWWKFQYNIYNLYIISYNTFILYFKYDKNFIVFLASERSERDTCRGNTIENRGCLFIYLYICMDVRKAFLYFDPRVFVLVMWSTPSQVALNRILWFIDQYPYHPRN